MGALELNTTLTSLSLGRNAIENQGAERLASALERNGTLTSVNLENNYITLNAGAFAKAVEYNSNLIELQLANNDIGFDGASRFEAGLDRNRAGVLVLTVACKSQGSERCA